MFTSIAGRAVVVTGGTRGIGKGIASVFARNGAKVLITGRDAEAARAAAEDLQAVAVAAAEPGEVSYVLADVSSREDSRRVAAIAQERLGGVDVLCANAGIFPEASLEDVTESDLDQVFGVNLKGTILSVQACLPALAVRPRQVIPLVHHRADHRVPRLDALRRGKVTSSASYGPPRSSWPPRASINAVLPGNIVTRAWPDGRGLRGGMTAAIPMVNGTVDEIGYTTLFFATDGPPTSPARRSSWTAARCYPNPEAMAAAEMSEVSQPRTPESQARWPSRSAAGGCARAAARRRAALAAEFGVSGATLRQALAVLEEAAWSAGCRAAAAFVARARSSAPVTSSACPRCCAAGASSPEPGFCPPGWPGGRHHRAGAARPARRAGRRPGADQARRRQPVLPRARQVPGPALSRAARAAARRLGVRAARGALRR
jgi:3-oxoacyl-[acyl-carrier protein] reductase